jgi:hypothetical protein
VIVGRHRSGRGLVRACFACAPADVDVTLRGPQAALVQSKLAAPRVRPGAIRREGLTLDDAIAAFRAG